MTQPAFQLLKLALDGGEFSGDTLDKIFRLAIELGDVEAITYVAAKIRFVGSCHAALAASSPSSLNTINALLEFGCPQGEEVIPAAIRSGMHAIIFLYDLRFPLSVSAMREAALKGSITTMDLLLSLGCPWDATVFAAAACGPRNLNHFALSWLINKGCPWDAEAARNAAGIPEIISSLHVSRRIGPTDVYAPLARTLGNHTPTWGNIFKRTGLKPTGEALMEVVSMLCAGSGNLDDRLAADGFSMLEWLDSHGVKPAPEALELVCSHDSGFALAKRLRELAFPWDERAAAAAAKGSGRNFDMLKWAIGEGCPWDERVPVFILEGLEEVSSYTFDILKYLCEIRSLAPYPLFQALGRSRCDASGLLNATDALNEMGCVWDPSVYRLFFSAPDVSNFCTDDLLAGKDRQVCFKDIAVLAGNEHVSFDCFYSRFSVWRKKDYNPSDRIFISRAVAGRAPSRFSSDFIRFLEENSFPWDAEATEAAARAAILHQSDIVLELVYSSFHLDAKWFSSVLVAALDAAMESVDLAVGLPSNPAFVWLLEICPTESEALADKLIELANVSGRAAKAVCGAIMGSDGTGSGTAPSPLIRWAWENDALSLLAASVYGENDSCKLTTSDAKFWLRKLNAPIG